MRYLNAPWGNTFYSDSGGTAAPQRQRLASSLCFRVFRVIRGRLFSSSSVAASVPLLFLHGSGCDSDDWTPVLRALPPTLRTICMDFRGHGRSDTPPAPFTLHDLADDVLALIQHLRRPAAILVGHSLGGMVAMDLAARSSLVSEIILLEGWTNLKASSAAFSGDRFYGNLDRSAIDAIQAKNRSVRNRVPPAVWAHLWASVQAFDASSFLSSAHIPIAEVYGEMGRTPATQDLLMIPPNPRIRLTWIPNAGHYLPHERPLEIAALCREFAPASP